jgi:hypothetical protein
MKAIVSRTEVVIYILPLGLHIPVSTMIRFTSVHGISRKKNQVGPYRPLVQKQHLLKIVS